MQENINYERVSIRLANQLATALYQSAVLETKLEEARQAAPQPPVHIPREDSDE